MTMEPAVRSMPPKMEEPDARPWAWQHPRQIIDNEASPNAWMPLRILAPLKGDRLLDVGCAAGEYTRVLAEGFDATDAIDIEPERLAVFSQALTHSAIADRIHVLNMSAEQLTFRDGAFDVVTAIETLEHVVDLDAALDEMRRVLKPGGYLLVTGPNRYFPLETHGWLWKGKRHSPASFPFLPWLRPVHRKLADARSGTVHSLRERVGPHGFQLSGSSVLDAAVRPKAQSSTGARQVGALTTAILRAHAGDGLPSRLTHSRATAGRHHRGPRSSLAVR